METRTGRKERQSVELSAAHGKIFHPYRYVQMMCMRVNEGIHFMRAIISLQLYIGTFLAAKCIGGIHPKGILLECAVKPVVWWCPCLAGVRLDCTCVSGYQDVESGLEMFSW